MSENTPTGSSNGMTESNENSIIKAHFAGAFLGIIGGVGLGKGLEYLAPVALDHFEITAPVIAIAGIAATFGVAAHMSKRQSGR